MSGSAGTEYQRAADAIKLMITAGRIKVGALVKVPEIRKLTGTTYPTARVVARRLTDEGILQAHPGKGFVVLAAPDEATAKQADTQELRRQLAQLRDEVQALSARVDAAGEQLERVDSSLEDLHDKLGYDYTTDGPDDRGEQPATAARRGRTG